MGILINNCYLYWLINKVSGMKKISFLLFSVILLFFTSFSQSVSNNLDFDGFDDYVAIPNGTAMFSGLSEFSMCGWVYPTNPNTSWPDFEGYFGIKNEGVCDFYIVQLYGLGLEARITTTDGTFTLNPADLSEVTMNEWQHFALVYDGTQLMVYYNGVLDGAINATGTINYNNLELWIGALDFQSSDFYLDGKVDEITCWSTALTEVEVNEYMCISGDPSAIDELVGYYNFNEEEGLTLPDYFGNYDGTLTNMTGTEWTVSEVCYAGYDILFFVTEEDGTTPIEDAAVNLEGIVKNTNANGEALFSNYDPGTYVYEVTKTDYYQSSGSVEVIDANITENVLLAPIVYYDITFILTEEPGGAPVEGAIVNLDGIIQYTNEDGETTFTGYLPGTFGYTILKDGYYLQSGEVEVIDENVVVDIELLIDGLFENSNKDFKIFPNPGNGLMYLNLTTIPDRIEVYDALGSKLFDIKTKQFDVELDIRAFPNGVYILNVVYEDEIYSQKLIKNQ